jgi:hypothetical protein
VESRSKETICIKEEKAPEEILDILEALKASLQVASKPSKHRKSKWVVRYGGSLKLSIVNHMTFFEMVEMTCYTHFSIPPDNKDNLKLKALTLTYVRRKCQILRKPKRSMRNKESHIYGNNR